MCLSTDIDAAAGDDSLTIIVYDNIIITDSAEEIGAALNIKNDPTGSFLEGI